MAENRVHDAGDSAGKGGGLVGSVVGGLARLGMP